MKKVKIGLALVSAVAATAVAVPAYAQPPTPPPTPAVSTSLNDQEKQALAFSREEERLAKELYEALAAKHSLTPFSRIATSETRHFDAIGQLLTRYQLPDPSANSKPGVYADPELQKLYDDWYARGIVSPEGAWQVGIELEKRDISDLKEMMAATDKADLDRVYGNLLAGSENHLKAFEAGSTGQTFAPGTGPGAQRAPGRQQNGQPGQPQGQQQGRQQNGQPGRAQGSCDGQGPGQVQGRQPSQRPSQQQTRQPSQQQSRQPSQRPIQPKATCDGQGPGQCDGSGGGPRR